MFRFLLTTTSNKHCFENLLVSSTKVAISDNSLPCQQSDSKVEENEPAVSVTSTAEEERTEACFCFADYKL